eukprot:6065385-Prymnesium_polylepis.1
MRRTPTSQSAVVDEYETGRWPTSTRRARAGRGRRRRPPQWRGRRRRRRGVGTGDLRGLRRGHAH